MLNKVLPAHEQLYPTKLLKTRLEEYILLDGKPPTQNRAFAKRVTGAQVLEAITEAQERTGLHNIDPRYYVGTCFHESGCTNEWDTEIATASSPKGFVSVGAFQIGEDEAKRFRFKLEDMLDLDKASECMVKLAESNRQAIRTAAAIPFKSPDPDCVVNGKDWIGGAIRAYLAITHNHGVGYMRQTIKNYGLNWAAYRLRNPLDNIVAHGYGEDCITGGSYWPNNAPPMLPNHRDLFLTIPFMIGEDVRELQRHLKITPDGVFGPATEQAVKLFQRSFKMTVDGECGITMWTCILSTD